MGMEDVEDGAVIPEGAFAASGETVEDGLAVEAEIGEDRACAVEFVGGGDKADVVIGVGEVVEIVELALFPRRFGDGVGIGAAFDDVGYTVAETLADFGKHGAAAAVFDYVVEKGGDGLVFVAFGFEDQSCDGHEMGDVGDGGFLSGLMRVFFGGEEEGFEEAWTEMGSGGHQRFGLRGSSLNLALEGAPVRARGFTTG